MLALFFFQRCSLRLEMRAALYLISRTYFTLFVVKHQGDFFFLYFLYYLFFNLMQLDNRFFRLNQLSLQRNGNRCQQGGKIKHTTHRGKQQEADWSFLTFCDLRTEPCLRSLPSIPLDLAHSRGAAFETLLQATNYPWAARVTQSWRDVEPRVVTETVTWSQTWR